MRLLNILCVGAAALSLAQPLLAEQQASTNQNQNQKQNEGQGQEQGRGLSYPKSKLQAPLGVANEGALGANAVLSQTDGGRTASPSRLSKVVVSHHRHHQGCHQRVYIITNDTSSEVFALGFQALPRCLACTFAKNRCS